MGLFTVLDALLDQPMEIALADVAVSNDVKEVLIYKKGELLPVYNIINTYESGLWDDTFKFADAIQVKQEKLSELYMESIAWTNQIVALL